MAGARGNRLHPNTSPSPTGNNDIKAVFCQSDNVRVKFDKKCQLPFSLLAFRRPRTHPEDVELSNDNVTDM